MKNSQNVLEPTGEQMALFALVGSRNYAKDLASQDLDLGQMTTVISGRNISASLTNLTPIGLLAKMLLESSAWKINPAFTGMYSLKWKVVKLPAFIRLTTMKQYTHDRQKCLSTVSVKILKKEGMKSKRLLFRLQVLVHRTAGNASGSSHIGLMPTPDASLGSGGKVSNPEKVSITGRHINGQKKQMSVKDYLKRGLIPKPNQNGSDLKTYSNPQVKTFLPTPSAMLVADVDMEKLDARRIKAKATGKNGNGFGPSLNELAVKGMLPTPRSSDKNGTGVHGDGGMDLRTVIAMGMMNTPTAQDADNSCLPKSQLNRDSVVGDILKTGITGQLNPRFVQEMMGYPPNWTELPFLPGETKA